MAPELTLGEGDIDSLAISPLRELGAYEAMWDNPGVTFKTISEKFATRPGALPSDFVPAKKAGEYADFVRQRFRAAHIDRFGVRVHGAGEYPAKLRDAVHPVELVYYLSGPAARSPAPELQPTQSIAICPVVPSSGNPRKAHHALPAALRGA
jgi:hypothetical protein